MTEFSVSDLFMPLAVEPASQVGIFNNGTDNSNRNNGNSNNSSNPHSNVNNSGFTSNFALDTSSGDDWKLLDSESCCFDFVNILNNGTEANQPIELDSCVVDAFFSSSNDTTPMFESQEQQQQFPSILPTPTDWTPLLDNAGPVVTNADVMSASESMVKVMTGNDTTLKRTDHQSNRVEKTTNRVYKPSSTTNEPLDRLGVIPYKRKVRTQPLLPIVPTSNDPVAIKRAKNTEAARRSRARKLKRMTQLEERVESLLSEKCALEREVCRLKELLRANDVQF